MKNFKNRIKKKKEHNIKDIKYVYCRDASVRGVYSIFNEK